MSWWRNPKKTLTSFLRSGFGNVYKGYCRGKQVAIKKLHQQEMDDNLLEEFRKEVAIMTYAASPRRTDPAPQNRFGPKGTIVPPTSIFERVFLKLFTLSHRCGYLIHAMRLWSQFTV
jgi:serine/threonine protein kinase